MQNFKIKKLTIFIVPVILLSGLNFCFINIQIALGEGLDSFNLDLPNMVFDAQPVVGSCTDNHSLASTADAPIIKQKSEPSTDNTENSLPPCCLNHDNTAKIETVRNREINHEFQPLAAENYCINYHLASAETFNVYSLGLSPPQENLLSSIVKKE